MTEQDFLRDKTRVIYESEKTIISEDSGEILRSEKDVVKKTSSEPDYIKVYYRTMMAVHEIGEIPLTFLLALSCEIGYSNSTDDAVTFFNNKTTRRHIGMYCGIGDNMVTKYIKRAVEKGLLFTTEDRGTYVVNPWMIAKGRWERIKELQANFEYDGQKWLWLRKLTETKEEPVTEEETA